jgi:hypothetical protein
MGGFLKQLAGVFRELPKGLLDPHDVVSSAKRPASV